MRRKNSSGGWGASIFGIGYEYLLTGGTRISVLTAKAYLGLSLKPSQATIFESPDLYSKSQVRSGNKGGFGSLH